MDIIFLSVQSHIEYFRITSRCSTRCAVVLALGIGGILRYLFRGKGGYIILRELVGMLGSIIKFALKYRACNFHLTTVDQIQHVEPNQREKLLSLTLLNKNFQVLHLPTDTKTNSTTPVVE